VLTEEVYLGIGSNIGDSRTIVEQALEALDRMSSCTLRGRSSLYRSAAVSDIPQDDYINAVARLDTELEPVALLLELQAIEHAYCAGLRALSTSTSSCSVTAVSMTAI